MDLLKAKRSDFKNIPHRKWDEDIGQFNSMLIVPLRKKHDSGYACMEFIALDENNDPVCKLGGCSDVVHIDGVGGYGKWTGSLPKQISAKGWSIDCLPCGYLRIFCEDKLTAGHDLSSFELYGEERKK